MLTIQSDDNDDDYIVNAIGWNSIIAIFGIISSFKLIQMTIWFFSILFNRLHNSHIRFLLVICFAAYIEAVNSLLVWLIAFQIIIIYLSVRNEIRSRSLCQCSVCDCSQCVFPL